MAKPKSIGFRLRGVAGLVVLIPMVAAVLVSQRWEAIESKAGARIALDVAGWLFFVAGCSLRIASIIFVGGRKGKGVVTNGPYSMCRNPLYLGSLMIALSGAMMLHCVSLLGAIVVASIFYALIVIPSEERQLHEAFPREWEAFTASTPRLMPKLRWTAGVSHIEVDLRALRNEAFRVIGMGMLPLFVTLVGHLRPHAWWPKWMVTIP